MKIEDNAIVLFQGDSITDCGRDRQNFYDLGNGYAFMAAAWFHAIYPEKKVIFLNRGNSGNRVKDLESRWEDDCIALKPTWVSILIGINDCWRKYDINDPTSKEAFEERYRKILNQTKEQVGANIILCEPFLLPEPRDRNQWREDLDPKIHVIRGLAREYEALYLPLDGIFAQAASKREPKFWTPDGVHPTPAGHGLIAKEWLRIVGVQW